MCALKVFADGFETEGRAGGGDISQACPRAFQNANKKPAKRRVFYWRSIRNKRSQRFFSGMNLSLLTPHLGHALGGVGPSWIKPHTVHCHLGVLGMVRSLLQKVDG
jgi:hypothetical protein